MTTIFCSNESVSLERSVEVQSDVSALEEIWTIDEKEKCIKWIKENNFNKICLQFPDDLLCHSTQIANDIKLRIDGDVYILGDTSYGSCCIDEIAASHINSDSIIHFGHACLSQVTRLPVYYIFSRFNLDVIKMNTILESNFQDSSKKYAIFYDIGYFHLINELKSVLSKYKNLIIGKLALNSEPDILCWAKQEYDYENTHFIYIGEDNQSFFNIGVSIKANKWSRYDPIKEILIEGSPLSSQWMRRRYYYIEKCKDAQSIGIVVGTLTTKGYLDMVKHIQDLAKKRGIRSYLISVGKINAAKLANFIEIDCFVLVGCPENVLYTSREFLKPLISVFEIEMALNPAWYKQLPDTYCTDFKELLPEGKLFKISDNDEILEHDVSLVTGKIRNMKNFNTVETNFNGCKELQEKGKNELSEISSSDNFQDRSWQGLDPALGQTTPVKIGKGRSGIPIKYSENPTF